MFRIQDELMTLIIHSDSGFRFIFYLKGILYIVLGILDIVGIMYFFAAILKMHNHSFVFFFLFVVRLLIVMLQEEK